MGDPTILVNLLVAVACGAAWRLYVLWNGGGLAPRQRSVVVAALGLASGSGRGRGSKGLRAAARTRGRRHCAVCTLSMVCLSVDVCMVQVC